LEGDLNHVGYRRHSIFGMMIPNSCPGVPHQILSPKAMWNDDEAFYRTSNKLARAFNKNFAQYMDIADEEILDGAPMPNDLL
jgi:phosphoenolpyruvate carboxykinase (ATP)